MVVPVGKKITVSRAMLDIDHRRRVMKKTASLFFSLILPLLLSGCFYPYEDEAALTQPVTPVYGGYYSYYYYDSLWPGYSYYYGPSYYYDRSRWSRPSYYPPRQWRSAPGYRPPPYRPGGPGWQKRPGGPPPRPGWQNKPGRPGYYDSRPDNRPDFRPQPGGPDFRPPSGGSPSPSMPMPRVHRW